MMKNLFTFAVSTLASSKSGVTPPMQNALYSPLVLLNPKKHKAQVVGHQFGCAEQEAGVGAVRELLK